MSEYFKKWCKATGIRTLKTMAETAIAVTSSGAVGLLDVDWIGVLSSAALAGLITILTCVKGLPELKV